MKKYLLKIFMVAIVALPFVACNDDDDTPWIEPVVTTSGVYVIHSGLTNNAELAYYDTETKEVSEKVFKNKNGQDLGDLATDMVVYGSKMYITVTGSNKIFVTDHSAKIISSIEPKNGEEPMKPRKIVAHNGKIYAGTVDGYLLRIDTISYTIEDKIKQALIPKIYLYMETLYLLLTVGMDIKMR